MNMRPKLSRRGFLTRLSAAGGALLLGGCDQLSQSPTFRDVLSKAECVTQSVQRFVLSQRAMAREFSESDISAYFKPNGSINIDDSSYQGQVKDGFSQWRLKIDGLVARPAALSLDELRRMPSRTQITRHDCVEGWSAIGKWHGVQLWRILQTDVSAIRWNDSLGFYRPRYQTRSELFIKTNVLSRFPTGDFGIQASAVHEYRSGVRYPISNGAVLEVPGYRTISTKLEIRILSATISWQFRNILGERYMQVPTFIMPRQTNFYGVRWEFID